MEPHNSVHFIPSDVPVPVSSIEDSLEISAHDDLPNYEPQQQLLHQDSVQEGSIHPQSPLSPQNGVSRPPSIIFSPETSPRPPQSRGSHYWNLPLLPGSIPSPRGEPEKNAAEMEVITQGVTPEEPAAILGMQEASNLIASGVEPCARLPKSHGGHGHTRSFGDECVNYLWQFVRSGRTERAWRFAAICPLVFWYASGGLGIQHAIRHVAVVLFVIAFFTMTPYFASHAFLWFAVSPAALLGFAIATLMFTIESRGHDYYAYMGPAYWHVVVMFIGFLWAGTMRVSPLRKLLGPAHFSLAYSIMFCTLRGAMLLKGGTTLKTPQTPELNLVTVLDESRRELPAFVWTVWRAMAPILQTAIDEQKNTTVWISKRVMESGPWMKPLVGKPVMYTLSQDESFVTIHMPGGFYVIRLLWGGGENVGWAAAAIEVGCVVGLIYMLMTLQPPPRKYIDRARAGSVLVAERLKYEADDLGKQLNLMNRLGGVPVKATSTTRIDSTNSGGDGIESEDDMGLRYVLDRRRAARIAKGISSPSVVEGRDRLISERLRARHSLSSSATAILQQDIILSMHEQLWWQPLGVSSALSHPFVVKAMQAAFTSMFVARQYLLLLEYTYPSERREIDYLAELYIDEVPISDLLAMWVQDCARLIDAITLVVGNKSYLTRDAAGARRVQVSRERLQAAAAAVRECDKVIKAVEDRLATEVKAPTLSDVSGCRRVATAIWISFYRKAFVRDQLRMADECEAYLNSLEERSWKGLRWSLCGFLMPLRVFLSGAGYIMVHTFRLLKDRRKPRKAVHPTPFLLARELAHGRPYILRPPSRGRIRRHKVVQMAVTGDATHLKQSSIDSADVDKPPSPSGLKELEKLPAVEYGPGTFVTQVNYEGDEHHLFQYHDLWHVVRFAGGATILVIMGLWLDDLQEERYHRTPPGDRTTTDWTNTVAAWGGVPFLLTLSLTLQGTLTRAFVNTIGIVAGTVSAYVCLLVPVRLKWFYIVFTVFTGAVWIWLSADSHTPWATFHPKLRNIAIMAMIQQVTIVTEGYYGFRDRDSLCIYWGASSIIGVLLAALIGISVVPTRANRCMRQNVADALFSASEAFAACVEISFSDGNDNLESRHHALLFRQEWEKYHEFQKFNGKYHLRSYEILQDDAFMEVQAPFSLFAPESNMHIVARGANRLTEYATMCKAQLNEIRRWATRDARPPDLHEIDLERKYKEILIEVTERFINTHALIQTAVDQAARWRWWWQKSTLSTLSRQQFLGTLERHCRASAKRLIQLGELLGRAAIEGEERLKNHSDVQSRAFAAAAAAAEAENSSRSGTPSTPSPLFMSEPAPVVAPFRDRRAVMWAYALLHLADLNYVGAHVALLFPDVPNEQNKSSPATSTVSEHHSLV